ncbi:unnamed protein product [Leptidea sinapis]|uniref:Caspase family p20 domain-containing protein n=1 Tax=Leptidea sinapis TaxID=189913 RepID=A0A5E4QR46_9NEOP|nr:unnamed protein product [Leptidea sinapis]
MNNPWKTIIKGRPVDEHFEPYSLESDEFNNLSEEETEIDNIRLDSELKRPPEYEENAKCKTPDIEPVQVNTIDEIFNTRALSKHAETYELEKFEKKCLLIFNQENILGYKPRLGTAQDVKSLEETFSKFGFDVEEHKDCTKEELFQVLKTFSDRDFTDYGCVAIAVLTHGTKDGRLRAKDQQYSEFDIIEAFKTYDKPTLVTKPKLLVIQACRGTKEIKGVVVGRSAKIRKDVDEDFEAYTIPVESDMLVLHSSYMGNPSHRDEVQGSWLIQTMCKKINELSSTHDLESIITEVKREVAIDRYHEEYNRRTLEMDTNKQIPVVTSTLIRKLYLRKYEESHISFSDRTETEVVEENSSSPLLVQFGPCSCFLNYFDYIKNCLRLFLEENPDDKTAQSFLDVSETFEDGEEFNTAKDRMTKAITCHLAENARHFEFYKYLYFYKQRLNDK